MRWFIAVCLASALCLTAACQDQALTGPTVDAPQPDQTPLASHGQPGKLLSVQASMSGVVSAQVFFPDISPVRCPNPSWQWIEFTVTGTMPYLGKVEGIVSHCSYVVPPDFIPDGSYGDGEFVLVAANGDELWGTYHSGTSGPAAPGVFWWQDTVIFDGGTGRFANASGGGSEWGTVDFSTTPPSLQYQVEGVISYDASDRRAD